MAPAPVLRPLAAVLADLTARSGSLTPRTLPVREALGAVLAEPLIAPVALPARSRALRAGYAVVSQDLVGASGYSPVPLAGPPPRVAAGDALREGADAVLPEDGVTQSGPLWEAVASVAPGENAVRLGEDARAGQVLRQAGEVFRSIDAAAALACGIEEARVRRAMLRVVAGGLEEGLALGEIEGAQVQFVQSADLSPTTFHNADVALVISDAALTLPDRQPIASALALRPGDTGRVSVIGSCIVIEAPRRIDAVVALAKCLVEPLVRHLTGQRPRVIWRRAPLARKVASTVGFSEFGLVRERDGVLEPLALNALSLQALGQAEGWILIPPESEGFAAGEVVEAYGL